MNSFSSAMFNAEGASQDVTIPDLTEEKLDEYPHRSMVAQDGTLASLAQFVIRLRASHASSW